MKLNIQKAQICCVVVLFLLVGCCSTAQAQGNSKSQNTNITIPDFMLIKVRSTNGSTSLTFSPDAPIEAGLPMDYSYMKDSTLWLNYSSVVGKFTKPKRDVYVRISNGTMPAGFELEVTARAAVSTGRGNQGIPLGTLTLTNSDQKLIKNVRTSHTGKGHSKGHNLIYQLVDTDETSTITSETQTTVTILYTIAD